jgi:hypothetical protein
MILNGTVMWIFYDRTRPAGEISYSGFGRYTVNATSFAYRYDEMLTYTHSDTGISVSQQPLREGMLLYTPVIEQDGLHLRNVDGQSDYFCSADIIQLNFAGGSYCKYRRVKSD